MRQEKDLANKTSHHKFGFEAQLCIYPRLKKMRRKYAETGEEPTVKSLFNVIHKETVGPVKSDTARMLWGFSSFFLLLYAYNFVHDGFAV